MKLCTLHSNATADEGFKEIRKGGETGWEQKLAQLAADDSIDRMEGLGRFIDRVAPWQSNPTLKNVMKLRKGRHRFYIIGHHTKCNYNVIYVMANKRDEDDQPDTQKFKNMIIRCLGNETFHQIVLPVDPEEEEQPNLLVEAPQ